MKPSKTRDTSWDTPYIHGKDQENNTDTLLNSFESKFTIFLDDKELEFSPEDFLHASWTYGFDTPCNICREHFDLSVEPPVRLLDLGDRVDVTDPLRQALPPLSVKNFHLRCLKASSIKYYPVSHPWHSSVAEAYALRVFNAKAAQTCYEAPVRTLMAIQRRFGPNCLLWHDYISIPQWQDEFRGTVILPQIFKIFENSGNSILHLEQQPPKDVVHTPSLVNVKKNNQSLKQFFSAHLFNRLWPIVEFDRAGEAYIMTNEYEILEPKFTALVANILGAVNAGSTTVSSAENTAVQWLNHLPVFVQERQKSKCFGYVLDMIAELGCRSFRDKFIGASELLGVSDYPTELPADAQDACLWLAERRIESSDVSPLLLQPSKEPVCEKARWLKGHTNIMPNMWGWGIQTQPVKSRPNLQEHSVQLGMQFVGLVTQHRTLDFRVNGSSEPVSNDLMEVISSPTQTKEEIIKRLGTLSTTSLFCPGSIQNNDNPSFDLNIGLTSSPIIRKVLDHLLHLHTTPAPATNSQESTPFYNDILALLALSCSVPTPNLSHFNTLTLFRLRQHICDSSERDLVWVTCPDCQTQSVFRVQCWQEPTPETRLYIIPGLMYQYTADSGTGLLIENGEIIGRARFCGSTCECGCDVGVRIN